MLYGILKLLFKITFKVFFQTLYQNRPEVIPKSGALIICANHPGAFLDPVVIASLVKRKVFFLAKGSVFKGKFANWILPMLNVIPIYRQQDDPTQMHKNEETFIRCYEHLGKGGTLMIFPEGLSLTERKLQPVKTGAARIALGAQEKYGTQLDIKIACVGINYDNPHVFRKDVYVSYSDVISVASYATKYKTEGFAAAEELTEEIRFRLESSIIHTIDSETDRLVSDIERLYKGILLKKQGIAIADKEASFELSKRIVLTINFFREREPERVVEMATRIRSYFMKLEDLGISDKVIKGEEVGSRWIRNFKELLLIVVGFPFFIFGLIHNYACFFIASMLSRNLIKQKEYHGAVGAATGMILFLIWYVSFGIYSWNFIHIHSLFNRPGFEWLLYFISWPVTGLFSWYYYKNLVYVNKRWILQSLFYKETILVAELILMRNNLIQDLAQAIIDRDKHGIEPWMYGGRKDLLPK